MGNRHIIFNYVTIIIITALLVFLRVCVYDHSMCFTRFFFFLFFIHKPKKRISKSKNVKRRMRMW